MAIENVMRKGTGSTASDIADIVGVVGAVTVSVVYGIRNAKEKKRIAQTLMEYDAIQLEELENSLSKLDSQNQRIEKLFYFISTIKGKKQSREINKKVSDIALSKSNKEKKLMYIVFGGALVLIIIGLLIKNKKK
jgi:Mg2+/citrate symporter